MSSFNTRHHRIHNSGHSVHKSNAVGEASGRSGVDIVLDGVQKKFPGQETPAVTHLDLTIDAGNTVMFVGPSGCGKTTSLKMINRLIEPTSGHIFIDGDDVTKKNATELRRKIGYVIQGGSLLPHLTVGDNVGLVPGLLKWKKSDISARSDELLDMVGLDPSVYRDRYPRELSGGQQQRVGVARGLAADPPVILMDEPFGAVDPITRNHLQDELLSIQEDLHKTIICVSHDIDEAIKLGDKIVIFNVGGVVEQYDTPQNILSSPANNFVADFVGSGSRLKQLALLKVSDMQLDQPPVCHIGDRVDDVTERVTSAGEDSVVILDEGERPKDWVYLEGISRFEYVPTPTVKLQTVVDLRSTLNNALDSMLSSSHGGALVTDRDRYVGTINYEKVNQYVHQQTRPDHEAKPILWNSSTERDADV
ncbi:MULTISPECIES: ABC transporter ATP-binding protein [Corynebacterium]|nr:MULTISPECIES: ABC transporter ATP-binding protein [Corynebacterium]MDN8623510.1 ABC transporter ATP-binding protein [Corynebacterium kroppenstedtii]